jgi:ABC-2 type transport system ATP-binding protein
MLSNAAIQIENLVKIYKAAEQPAVNGVTLNIEAQSIFGLLGPNGAGKTTLLSVLCGLLKPTRGNVRIEGLNVDTDIEKIKYIIGVVPQDIALYPTLTAFENLQYIGNMYGLKGQQLKQRISECLQIFGLENNSGTLVKKFSGGMKRRINLIAGILHRPQILFLDEPTVGVDVQSRNVIREYLKTLNSEGTTIVYTSHMMEEVENLCTRIAIIDQGTIIADGVPAALIGANNAGNLEQLFLKLTGKSLRD